MLHIIEKLKNIFRTFPSIGEKSALKIAIHFIEMNSSERDILLKEIQDLSNNIHICSKCYTYSDKCICDDCISDCGDEGILCIVETAIDALMLKSFLPTKSKFHVLNGKLSPINGISVSDLNFESLKDRIVKENLKEVILATGSDVEGEATASYVKKLLNEFNIKITRLSFGLSVGSSLNSADELSIQKSLSARTLY